MDDAIITVIPLTCNFFSRTAVPPCSRSSRIGPIAMIQRKQTVFLLLAALCGALTFLFPVDTFVRGDQAFEFQTTGFFMADGTPVVDGALKVPFAPVIGLITVLLVAIVFFYKNRQRQLLLTRTANLLTMAVVVFLFITDNSIRAYLAQGGRVESTFGASAGLPLLMIVLILLAESGIRKDQALVKSMDRLR